MRTQLYTWRKQFRHGELTGFVPVSITPEPVALSASEPLLALPPQPPAVEPAPDLATSCLIEVELPSGVKLRIPGDADETSLRRILSALS